MLLYNIILQHPVALQIRFPVYTTQQLAALLLIRLTTRLTEVASNFKHICGCKLAKLCTKCYYASYYYFRPFLKCDIQYVKLSVKSISLLLFVSRVACPWQNIQENIKLIMEKRLCK
jgi:hypothetical protein